MTTAELLETIRNCKGMFGAESKKVVKTRRHDGLTDTFIKQILFVKGKVYLISETTDGGGPPVKSFQLYKDTIDELAELMEVSTLFQSLVWQVFDDKDTYSLFCTIPMDYTPKQTNWVSPFRT
jgi:hypothetical protein